MRPIPLLLAVFLCLSLPACVHTRLCGTAEPGAPVHIDVTYAEDGMPVVTPETCTVEPGVAITWRGPVLDDTPFRLTFQGDPGTVTKGTPPGIRMRAPRGLGVEAATGVRREVRITAENPGTYKYDVDANARSLDPHIIIER